MVPQFFLALATTLQLWLGGAAVAPTRVAQLAEPAPTPSQVTDRAADRVAAVRAQRQRAVTEKSRLAKRYEAQLAEIDRLKKSRASWRRDRMIRQQKADSLTTGRALQELDTEIRRLDGRLRSEQQALISTIDRELETRPAPTRRHKLLALRRATGRELHRDKKIVLPDDTIDPLADPEELEYQAARIAQSEKELAREIALLGERAKRYRHMDKLRRQRARAAQAGRWDDSRSRRTAGRISDRQNGAGGGLASLDDNSDGEAGPPSPIDEDPAVGGGYGEYSDPTVVLVEVVDTDTLDALRNAQSSGNLVVKAKAAERASKQVHSQLERLRRQRLLIEKRAAELRK